MSRTPLAAGLAAMLALTAGCVPRTPAPAPAPPAPAPAPAPAPPPAQVVAWEDAPLSPGTWFWREENGSSLATFGTPDVIFLRVRCEPSREVILILDNAATGPLTLRTSFGSRALPASAGPAGLSARVGGGDPLLDELAFSRGRFAVEAPGAERLIFPSWPEMARVVEDCRG